MILVELRRAVFFQQAHAEYLTAGCLWLHTMESNSSGGELQEGGTAVISCRSPPPPPDLSPGVGRATTQPSRDHLSQWRLSVLAPPTSFRVPQLACGQARHRTW